VGLRSELIIYTITTAPSSFLKVLAPSEISRYAQTNKNAVAKLPEKVERLPEVRISAALNSIKRVIDRLGDWLMTILPFSSLKIEIRLFFSFILKSV
jgi:hypothetical protein